MKYLSGINARVSDRGGADADGVGAVEREVIA